MDPMMLVLIVGGMVAVILLIVGVLVTSRSEQAFIDERLGEYVDEELVEGLSSESTESPVSDWLNVQVERSQWGSGIATTLAQADLKLKPAEYIGTMILASIAVGAIAWYFGGKAIFSGAIGAVIGLFLPRIYVNRQKNQRLNIFNDQLQDMLNLVVNGLRAGFSIVQAMESVAKELPPPISSEFFRVVQEMQLGITMETALDNLVRRIPSDDLDLIIVAINVQREVGGNLAEILDTISYTIRERVRIKGEIRVLTAQVMYSGRFLALLPIILSLILWFANRSYMMTFFDNLICGLIMLSVAAIMVGIGYFVMTRIADIEV
jgi:tight adherence protein B